MKSSEVSIKTRSPPASFSFKGQTTKHTTVRLVVGICMRSFPVKWSILLLMGNNAHGFGVAATEI